MPKACREEEVSYSLAVAEKEELVRLSLPYSGRLGDMARCTRLASEPMVDVCVCDGRRWISDMSSSGLSRCNQV